MRSVTGGLLAVLLCLLLAGTARGTANETLQRCKQLYMGLQFDKAAVQLDKALRFANRHADLVDLYELQGLTYAALGKNEKAREAFARLLMIDPEHALPDYVAPRMTRPLQAARSEYAAGGWLSASARGPATIYHGDPVTVEVRLENDPFGMADRFRISYRGSGSGAARDSEVRAGPLARVSLDLAGGAFEGGLEYWVTVLDSHGGELYFIGSDAEPLRVVRLSPSSLAPMPAEQNVDLESRAPAPFYDTWWFWTAVGVVTAGAVVGIALAVAPRDPEQESSTIWVGVGR